jgi:hypothetical protein
VLVRITSEGPAIRRIPRKRRQVSRTTLRVARLVGFRYDEGRDAYVLRLVGDRVGPVLRGRPPVDSTAAQIEWSESMDRLADRQRRGRFESDPKGTESAERDVLKQ